MLPAFAAESFTEIKLNIGTQGTSDGCFRFVAGLNSFPFEVTENSLANYRIKGAWTHKTSKAVINLDSTIKSNEMRTDTTVIVVNPSDMVTPENIDYTTGNEYDFDFTLYVPQSIEIDETNFTPFKINVMITGSSGDAKRLVISTNNFPFCVNKENQIVNCMLSGTVTYSGDETYSKMISFEDVEIIKSDVRNDATAIDFKVPVGYTIAGDNSEDKNYTWDLTISPESNETIETDLPKTGSTFFVLPEMFKQSDSWTNTISDTYTVLFSEFIPQEDISTSIYIPKDGKYTIYSFVRDSAINKPGTRFANIAVNNTAIKTAGKHSSEGFCWEKIGEISLKEGDTAKVTLMKTSAQYARVAAIMFTTEENYVPEDEYFFNNIKVAKAQLAKASFSESESNLILLPDDFESDYGTWSNIEDGDIRVLMGLKNGGMVASDATAKIEIPQNGTYYVWGYAKDYTLNNQGGRAAKIGIDRSTLSGFIGVFGAKQETGKNGSYGWDLAGKVVLKKGTAIVSLKDVKKNYSRVAAIVLTTDADFNGTNTLETDAEKYRAKIVVGELEFSNLYSNGNNLSYT